MHLRQKNKVVFSDSRELSVVSEHVEEELGEGGGVLGAAHLHLGAGHARVRQYRRARTTCIINLKLYILNILLIL